MVNLVTCAVGQPYIDNVHEFLSTHSLTGIKVHILTDKPSFFPKYHTQYFYRSYFNFFDKFLFGLKVIEQTKKGAYIWDADLIDYFNIVRSKFDTKSSLVQFDGCWQAGTKLSDLENSGKKFFDFFDNWLTECNLTRNDIYNLQEHWSYWPYKDYSQLVDMLSHISFLFEQNTRLLGGHKNSFGNGEGPGICAGLRVCNIDFTILDVV
jgi:hypothetical protein